MCLLSNDAPVSCIKSMIHGGEKAVINNCFCRNRHSCVEKRKVFLYTLAVSPKPSGLSLSHNVDAKSEKSLRFSHHFRSGWRPGMCC